MNKPFFQLDLFGNTIDNTPIKKKKEKNPCEKCGLKIKSEKTYYNEKSDILVIIDYYNQNINYIKEKLEGYNYTLTFALQCQNNDNITVNQINSCRNTLKKVIEEIQPKKILTFGLYALQSLIGDKISVTNIETFAGWQIPDQDYGCFIFPNFYLENDENIVLNNKFEEYLNVALNWNKKFKVIEPIINICNEQEAINNLINIQSLKEETIAIDFETNALKPHKKGCEIYSISITQNNLFTFSFLLTDKIKPYVIKIFDNENIKKLFQNLQFEIKWSKEYLTEIKNIIWDTQLASHILDNRSDITGLKFQTYINFGLVGYEEKIDKYIKSIEKSGYSFNSIKEAPIEEILKYNGYDTYFTMLLQKKQKNLIDQHLKKGFDLFLEGNIELSKLSGIRFNKDLYEKNYKELTDKINELHNKIMNSREVKLWNKEDFNYDSSDQLRELLFDVCKWDSKFKTKNDKNSVDEETLKKLDKKFTNLILERRKLLKLRDTYLSQFEREAVEINGEWFIFPFFSLNNVKTMRSASQLINFQNIPARNEYAQIITKSCLIPRRNHQLLEIDFKAMEVSIGCAYHQDPVMINYVNHNGDMHGDLANQLFFRNNDFTKYERYCAKNKFVFPSFYGSTARIFKSEHKKLGAGDITVNLWESLKDETKEHLKENNIFTLQDYQFHVEDIEKDFWGNRFKIYQQWKFDNWKEYKEKGFIELYTGFRLNSIMSFNDVNNYPVQGSAFHVALKTLIELNKFLRKEKFNSVIVGEIHDSIVIDVDPMELHYIAKIIKKIIAKIKEEWTWIRTELKVEFSVTPINGSWNLKEEIDL